MSMTIDEFKESFRSVMMEEFQNVPTNERSINISVSAHFEKKMNKLIKATNRSYWRWVNTVGKRVALLIVAILLLFSTAFSVKAVREPIIRFFTEIYEKYIVIGFEGETSKTIEYVYSISEIPEGYTVVDEWRDVTGAMTTLHGPNGAVLILDQSITDNGNIYQDNEKGNVSYHSIEGTPVILYENENSCIAICTKDAYSLSRTHDGESSQEKIMNIIRTIK